MTESYYAIQWPLSQHFMNDRKRTHLAVGELYDLIGDSAYLVREDYYSEVIKEVGHIPITCVFTKVSKPLTNKTLYTVHNWDETTLPKKDYFVLK